MARRYVRAIDVLSEGQLAAVSKSVKGRGCFLWIPSARSLKRKNRDAYVLHLHEEGRTNGDIADRLFISKRTVRRIVARERARCAPSASAASEELQ
jgi:DNA-binding NarL/FixJ family response regulator